MRHCHTSPPAPLLALLLTASSLAKASGFILCSASLKLLDPEDVSETALVDTRPPDAAAATAAANAAETVWWCCC